MIPYWNPRFVSNLQQCQESRYTNIFLQPFVYLNVSLWQSYQLCQRKILSLAFKNRPSKPNLGPQFIIRMTSNWGHYFLKVTPNLPTYRIYPADLCTKIFNGVYCISTLRFTIRFTISFTIRSTFRFTIMFTIRFKNKVHNKVQKPC